MNTILITFLLWFTVSDYYWSNERILQKLAMSESKLKNWFSNIAFTAIVIEIATVLTLICFVLGQNKDQLKEVLLILIFVSLLLRTVSYILKKTMFLQYRGKRKA